jgi:hypothetical protein
MAGCSVGRKEYLTAQAYEYGLQLWVYEMVSKTWYRWRIRLPNPTPAPEPEPGPDADQREAAPRGADTETQTIDPATPMEASQEATPSQAEP